VRPPALLRALLCAALATLAVAPAAHAARTLYVPNFTSNTLSSYAVGANSSLTPLGMPLVTGGAPEAAVVTPNGKFLFLTVAAGNRVERYSIGADGTPASLGSVPLIGARGAAISLDGTKLYVASDAGVTTYAIAADGGLTSVDTKTLTGTTGRGLALTPDGRSLYATVGDATPDDTLQLVPVGADGIPTANGTVLDSAPEALTKPTITPDGRFLYVPTASFANVALSAIRGYAIGAGGALTALPGSPFSNGGRTLGVGASPVSPVLFGVEASTNTARSYVIGADGGLAAAGSPIPTGDGPASIAVAPSGRSMFATNFFSGDVSRFDVAANGVLSSAGANAPAGTNPGDLSPAVSPNQGPSAAFTASAVKGGSPTDFNASGSTDPDGTVLRYDWDFGDGTSLPNGGATPQHTYTTAGTYSVTLTVTDDESCSLTRTFTGQVVGCNPSGAARVSQPVQSLPHPLPVVGLGISKVSANRYCLGKGEGTAKDPAFSFTLSDPAAVTLTVQKRTTPVVKPKRSCPVRKPGGPGAIPVQYSDVVTSARSFSTVKPAATKKARAAAKLSKTINAPAGTTKVKLSSVLGSAKLKPGWYRLLISARRADGSLSKFVTVKFWVLDTTKAKTKTRR
jgi:6-phosphogluconolactonase (cycloisomerase 2 family)